MNCQQQFYLVFSQEITSQKKRKEKTKENQLSNNDKEKN